MNVGDLNKVWEIRALKRKPAAEEATKMLEKIAKQVQPIMRKHKWRIKLLSEMWYFKFSFFVYLFINAKCHSLAFCIYLNLNTWRQNFTVHGDSTKNFHLPVVLFC